MCVAEGDARTEDAPLGESSGFANGFDLLAHLDPRLTVLGLAIGLHPGRSTYRQHEQQGCQGASEDAEQVIVETTRHGSAAVNLALRAMACPARMRETGRPRSAVPRSIASAP